MPALLLTTAFCFALFTASSDQYIFYWSGMAFLASLVLSTKIKTGSPSLILFSIASLIIILIFNQVFISPLYSEIGVYITAYLVFGLLAGLSLSEKQLLMFFKFSVLIMVILSGWAFIQLSTGSFYIVPMFGRANTLFTTPNTFAACINLFLLPLVVLYVFKGDRNVFLAIGFLLVALFLSSSRGGFLSFLISLVIFSTVVYRQHNKPYLNRLGLFTGMAVIVFTMVQWFQSEQGTGYVLMDRLPQTVESGDPKRIDLYESALSMIQEKPLLGSGFMTYQFRFVTNTNTALYNDRTAFVHNDYLQYWLELGIMGLLSLIAIGLSVLFYIYKIMIKNSHDIAGIALACAMLSQLIHAGVDFTLYPIPLMMIFGLYAAGLHRCQQAGNVDNRRLMTNNTYVKPVLISGFLLWQLQPVLAQAAAQTGLNALSHAQVTHAITAYDLAITLAPYKAEYYWAAGRICMDQASYTKDKSMAEKADDYFYKGSKTYPWELKNLITRLQMARDKPEIFAQSPKKSHLRLLLADLKKRAPAQIEVDIETVKTLYVLEGKSVAQNFLDGLIDKHGAIKQLTFLSIWMAVQEKKHV